jgi:hypothetical protein
MEVINPRTVPCLREIISVWPPIGGDWFAATAFGDWRLFDTA